MLTCLENAWREKISQWRQVHCWSPESWRFRDKQAKIEFGMPGPHMVCEPLTTRESQGGLMEWWEFHPTLLIVSCVVAQENRRQNCWKIVSAVDAGENWVLWKKISLASPRPHHPLSAWHRPTERFASRWKARNKCFLQTLNSPAAAHLVALRVVSWLLRIRWS